MIKPNGAIVLTASQPFTSALVMSNPKMFKYEMIWKKNKATGFFHVKYRPMKDFENILVFSRGGCAVGSKDPMKYFAQGTIKLLHPKKRTRKGLSATISNVVEPRGSQSTTNYPRSVLSFANETGFHPTQKPVALFEYLIKTYTNEGDLVLDNVAGSGTTGVACQNLNRNFILMEQEPEYVEIIKQRLAANKGER